SRVKGEDVRATRNSLAWTALCMCLSGTVAHASTWQLRVFNVDDKINVFLNGAGAPILTCTSRQSCDIDLTTSMVTGTNPILLRLINTTFGVFNVSACETELAD